MGLRTASVRHPHVEVMAPALTEAGQAQGFNLSTKTVLRPASPLKDGGNEKASCMNGSDENDDTLRCNVPVPAVTGPDGGGFADDLDSQANSICESDNPGSDSDNVPGEPGKAGDKAGVHNDKRDASEETANARSEDISDEPGDVCEGTQSNDRDIKCESDSIGDKETRSSSSAHETADAPSDYFKCESGNICDKETPSSVTNETAGTGPDAPSDNFKRKPGNIGDKETQCNELINTPSDNLVQCESDNSVGVGVSVTETRTAVREPADNPPAPSESRIGISELDNLELCSVGGVAEEETRTDVGEPVDNPPAASESRCSESGNLELRSVGRLEKEIGTNVRESADNSESCTDQSGNLGSDECVDMIGGSVGLPDQLESDVTMNKCQSMGDDEEEEKTVLHKLDPNSMIANTNKKDRLEKLEKSDVEQLLNNISSSDIMSQPSVDEIMAAISTMTANSDRLSGMPSEDVFPISSTDLSMSLLSDVDMMNISMEDQQDQLECQSKDMIEDLKKKQVKVERRLDFLRRRVLKLQARCMGQHVGGEVAGVYEYVHRSLKRLKDTSVNEIPRTDFLDPSAPPPTSNVEKCKPISFAIAKTLTRKLETSTILQANSSSRQRHSAKYFGAGSAEPSSMRNNSSGMLIIPTWDLAHKQELQKVAGSLQTQFRIIQEELDSEATDSSSGGESCDESQIYVNPHMQYLSIQKRALWKYSTERAAIAARWTWLQAQISDLEYRIRQHTELHRQVRTEKGPVILGGASPPRSPTDIPLSPTPVNGYRGQLPGSSPPATSKVADGTTANGAYPDYLCARARPVVNLRKRKLFQTSGLHVYAKKAARPSTVRCGCTPPQVSCALCTGRTDPTHPRDPIDTLSKTERISLLDPGYHPVFSWPEDVSEGIHLEAIMKSSDWQQKCTKMKSIKILSKAERMEKSALEHRANKLERRKKYARMLKSPSSALSVKIKNKMRGRKAGRHGKYHKKRLAAKASLSQMQSVISESVDDELESIGNISNAASASRSLDSPSSSPLLHMQSISAFNRKNRINSYDIDNIVIPYSVAASTRVEKLQYKEILTPKWRIVDPEFAVRSDSRNGAVRDPSQDSDAEDLSEEAMIIRHDKSEYDERKKFLSYIKMPVGYGRARAHKRTDSRAESSGANTPDPMSPHPVDQQENTNSPITSPPATPLPLNTEDPSTLPSISDMRRRTISQSRIKEREIGKDENSCGTPEQEEVPPYDARVFPLSEDVYEKMLKTMPENHQLQTNIWAQDSATTSCCSPLPFSHEKSPPRSPSSESTESALGDEDPNDPEWLEEERAARDRHKSSPLMDSGFIFIENWILNNNKCMKKVSLSLQGGTCRVFLYCGNDALEKEFAMCNRSLRTGLLQPKWTIY